MAIVESRNNPGAFILKHGRRGFGFGDQTFESAMVNQKYKIFGKKGEGTFSEVLKCQNLKNGAYYACKKMKQQYSSWEQVNNLREIQAMKRLNPHDNIISLHDIIFDSKNGLLVLILELMDLNLYELIKDRKERLPESKVKNYMWQLCKAIDHVHSIGIFHRDVKPENILIKDDLLKLADFGSCRCIKSRHPYTEYISTRWYRAPECLLTDGYYGPEMDMWSVGCVMYEVITLRPLFPGSNEVDQISKIHDILGCPDSQILERFRTKTRTICFNFPKKKGTGFFKLLNITSTDGTDLIRLLCTYDPEKRINAQKALKVAYFRECRDREQRMIFLSRNVSNNTPQSSESKRKSLSSPHQKPNAPESSPASTLISIPQGSARSLLSTKEKSQESSRLASLQSTPNKENLNPPNENIMQTQSIPKAKYPTNLSNQSKESNIDTIKLLFSERTHGNSQKIWKISDHHKNQHGKSELPYIIEENKAEKSLALVQKESFRVQNIPTANSVSLKARLKLKNNANQQFESPMQRMIESSRIVQPLPTVNRNSYFGPQPNIRLLGQPPVTYKLKAIDKILYRNKDEVPDKTKQHIANNHALLRNESNSKALIPASFQTKYNQRTSMRLPNIQNDTLSKKPKNRNSIKTFQLARIYGGNQYSTQI